MWILNMFITGFICILFFNQVICNSSVNENNDDHIKLFNSTQTFDEHDDDQNENKNNNHLKINNKEEYDKIKVLSQFFKMPTKCPYELNTPKEVNYCPSTVDYLSCFPSIPPNTTTNITCPFVDSIKVNDSSLIAYKRCHENGTWEVTDYTSCFQYLVQLVYKSICRKINKTITINKTLTVLTEVVECENITIENDEAVKYLPTLFFIGYTIALVPIILAIFIFWSFRSLRCLRNMIHSNMLLTFIFKSLVFILVKLSLFNINEKEYTARKNLECLLFKLLWHYTVLTSFFWMMVEGIYLISVVIAAYSSNKIKLWWYLVIGWVLPILPLIPYTISAVLSFNKSCNWIKYGTEAKHELFIEVPIYIVLAVNFVLLVTILFIIIKKLKENNDAAKARYNQYKKLIRATIFLIPLLGLTYGLFFWLPKNPKTLIAIIYCYINIFLQTSQGVWVAVVYCFYNEEVKTVIKNKFRSWKATRNLEMFQRLTGKKRKTSRTQSFAITSMATYTRTPKCTSNNSNDVTMIPILKNKFKENELLFTKIPENRSIK